MYLYIYIVYRQYSVYFCMNKKTAPTTQAALGIAAKSPQCCGVVTKQDEDL